MRKVGKVPPEYVEDLDPTVRPFYEVMLGSSPPSFASVPKVGLQSEDSSQVEYHPPVSPPPSPPSEDDPPKPLDSAAVREPSTKGKTPVEILEGEEEGGEELPSYPAAPNESGISSTPVAEPRGYPSIEYGTDERPEEEALDSREGPSGYSSRLQMESIASYAPYAPTPPMRVAAIYPPSSTVLPSLPRSGMENMGAVKPDPPAEQWVYRSCSLRCTSASRYNVRNGRRSGRLILLLQKRRTPVIKNGCDRFKSGCDRITSECSPP